MGGGGGARGVTRGQRQFWVSICPLIFKQQAGGVLVTDKEAGLSSHSLTSTHSALLSGRHLESRKQLRASDGGGKTQHSGVGRYMFVCTCTCMWRLRLQLSSFLRGSPFFSPVQTVPHPLPLPPPACPYALFTVVKPDADCVIMGNSVRRGRKV